MKYILKYLSILIVVLLLASCEDILDLEPKTMKTTEVAFATFDGVVEATNGAYSPLYQANWYGRNFTVTSDIKGGNAKLSPINTGRFRIDYTWTNNDANTSGMYEYAYKVITRASNVINYSSKLEDPTMDKNDEEVLINLVGECHFLRALAYFDLVRMYSQPYSYAPESLGLPIVTVPDIEARPKRSTVSQVYELIINDLNKSIENLPLESRDNEGSIAAFANKYSAYALKAKVSLYMEEWQNAADYANKVIEEGGYNLYTSANYLDAWGKDAQSEVIFEIYGKDGQGFYPEFDDIGNIYSPDGYGDVCASNDLLNLFETGDIRADLFKGHTEYPGYFWPLKYPGKNHIRENNISVLRLSEMYLIRAEATLNGAKGYNALNDYNTLRNNRGLTNAGSVGLQDIYDERRRELCFEGNQLWDLSRTKRGLNRDENEIKITEKENIDIPFPDYRWAMPIPVYEKTVNENIDPNPGY